MCSSGLKSWDLRGQSTTEREGGRRVVCVWVLVLVGLIGAGVYISNGGLVCVCFVFTK